MTNEEMLFYAGMLGGYLNNEGIKVTPIVHEGLYTGNLEIEVSNGVHITIKIIDAYDANR